MTNPEEALTVKGELHVYERPGCKPTFIFFERNDSLAAYTRDVLEPVAFFIIDKYGLEPKEITVQEKTKNSELYEEVRFKSLDTRIGNDGKLEVTNLTSVSTREKYTEQEMNERIGQGIFNVPDLGARRDIDQSELLKKSNVPTLDVTGTRIDPEKTPER